jgi:hypothetical protein
VYYSLSTPPMSTPIRRTRVGARLKAGLRGTTTRLRGLSEAAVAVSPAEPVSSICRPVI